MVIEKEKIQLVYLYCCPCAERQIHNKLTIWLFSKVAREEGGKMGSGLGDG